MKIRIITFIAFLIVVASCNSGPKKGPIELNNGEKWQINAEMMPPLKSSESLLTSFKATDLQSYKSLAKELTKNNKVLISSCTMKGKSHDELHKWLHPYMGMINDLEDVSDITKAAEIVGDMRQSFATFNKNFH